jgi:hypothetical protein
MTGDYRIEVHITLSYTTCLCSTRGSTAQSVAHVLQVYMSCLDIASHCRGSQNHYYKSARLLPCMEATREKAPGRLTNNSHRTTPKPRLTLGGRHHSPAHGSYITLASAISGCKPNVRR